MKEWFETEEVFCMVTEFAQGQLFEIMEAPPLMLSLPPLHLKRPESRHHASSGSW